MKSIASFLTAFALLARGDQSHVIDLHGRPRLIDKAVFHYEARGRGWNGAELKLFGVRP